MVTSIKFENISKQYRLGLVTTKTLQHDLNRWWQTAILRREDPYLKISEINDRSKKGTSEYVWALRGIDYEVKQGDVLGIIGKNGAGKSTLLKLLSKVTSPTIGAIKIRGRIASLLEVGTGFHPELTGRENIFLNGCIMGMTKPEIRRKMDEIIYFAGVERYVDTPVKRYSSGMEVRLGFSIAAHLEPDILVVDEVLAVGDAEFQKKAIGKMQDVSKGEGRTVLFVSHNMEAVKSLCKTGIILENGQIVYSGTAKNAVSLYLNKQKAKEIYESDKTKPLFMKRIFTGIEPSKNKNTFEMAERPRVFIDIACSENPSCLKDVYFNIDLLNKEKHTVCSVDYELNRLQQTKDNIYRLSITFEDNFIAPGEYSFTAIIQKPNIEMFDFVEDICFFEILDNEKIQYYRYANENLMLASIIARADIEQII